MGLTRCYKTEGFFTCIKIYKPISHFLNVTFKFNEYINVESFSGDIKCFIFELTWLI